MCGAVLVDFMIAQTLGISGGGFQHCQGFSEDLQAMREDERRCCPRVNFPSVRCEKAALANVPLPTADLRRLRKKAISKIILPCMLQSCGAGGSYRNPCWAKRGTSP